MIDWDATLAYREYLWSLGFGVAEAMDTAQRGMGLDWPLALELIQRSTAAANARAAVVASGAGTDHLPAGAAFTLQDVTNAYLRQCEAIEAVGRTHHPDGQPRAGSSRAPCGRLRVSLCHRARAGSAAGHSALAGSDVRSGAARLLGRRLDIAVAMENCLGRDPRQ